MSGVARASRLDSRERDRVCRSAAAERFVSARRVAGGARGFFERESGAGAEGADGEEGRSVYEEHLSSVLQSEDHLRRVRGAVRSFSRERGWGDWLGMGEGLASIERCALNAPAATFSGSIKAGPRTGRRGCGIGGIRL